MKRCIDQTAQPCNIESIKDDLGEQGWEVITNEEVTLSYLKAFPDCSGLNI